MAGRRHPWAGPGIGWVVGVLAAHLLLLAGWGGTPPPPPRPGPAPASVAVRLVPVPVPAVAVAVRPAAPVAPAGATVDAAGATAAGRQATGATISGIRVVRTVTATAMTAASAASAASPATAMAPTLAQAPDPAPADPSASASSAAAGAWAASVDDPLPTLSEAANTRPPPVYPARPLPPGRWHFLLRQGSAESEAVLDWQHDGERFQLRFEAVAAGRPVVRQASEGRLGAAGLSPGRFVDQRRGRGARALSIDPEAAEVRFSATDASAPAWAATQDRLSWLLQLAAVAAAADAAGEALPEVVLHLVDVRGGSGLWLFTAAGEVPLATPAGPRPARLWRHEPTRPDGLRLEVWLDPADGLRPLRLRQTVLRSGTVTEWLPRDPRP